MKTIYVTTIDKYGGKILFESSLSEKDTAQYYNSNSFLNDILKSWIHIFGHELTQISSNTTIWNNSAIRSGNKPLLYKKWIDKGITTLGDIFDIRTHSFYTFDFMQYIYNIPDADFLKYSSLIRSIPKDIKTSLKNEGNVTLSTTNFLNKVVSCPKPTKLLYTHQIKAKQISIKQIERWETVFENNNIEWKNVFKTPHTTTVDSKLRNFQYKYIMRIVRTNKDLFKFKLVNSTLCDFCNQASESRYHLFWECSHVQELWRQISNIFLTNNITIQLSYETISFGTLTQRKYTTPINYIILLAKYYIFRSKCLKENLTFTHFKRYLIDKIRTEQHIAQRKGKLQLHEARWNGFIMN